MPSSKDFPFTTYDFYAYLASGLILLFLLDLVFTGGKVFSLTNWNFVNSTIIVSLSYISGQIIAIPSSTILEHFLFPNIFYKPIQLQLGAKMPRWRERVLSSLVGRYYEPLHSTVRQKIMDKVTKSTSKEEIALLEDTESVFLPAYSAARKNEDARGRMDDFRNQYGFARNITFVGLVIFFCAVLSCHSSREFLILVACLTVGMFIRFLKFYSAFFAEILRTYAYSD